MNFFLNKDWFDTLNNRYIYTDNQIMICLFTKTKKVDLLKNQIASYVYFEYKRRGYLKANKASI